MLEPGITEALRYYAKQLKIPTFGNLDKEVHHYRPGQSVEAFVLELMKREYETRQEKKRQTRLKRAHFPLMKTLEEFDMSRLQYVKPEYVKQLASCDFISRHENMVMVGNPGTGKAHLMTAIGIKACILGYKVLFTMPVLWHLSSKKQGVITSYERWKRPSLEQICCYWMN